MQEGVEDDIQSLGLLQQSENPRDSENSEGRELGGDRVLQEKAVDSSDNNKEIEKVPATHEVKFLEGNDLQDGLEDKDHVESVLDLIREGCDFCVLLRPNECQSHCVEDDDAHNERIKILVLDDLEAHLADSVVSLDLGLWFALVALEIHLDPLFLKVSEQEVPIDLALLSVESVDDNFDEQVGDEQTAKDHVADEDVLVPRILSPFGLLANPN